LDALFDVLFSANGAAIYLLATSDRLRPAVAVDLHSLIESAARRGETAGGYRPPADAQNKDASFGASFGLGVNPKQSLRRRLQTGDPLIGLADGVGVPGLPHQRSAFKTSSAWMIPRRPRQQVRAQA